MKKHLVFVGGGHAHLTALLHLKDYVDRGHRVTLISASEYHYYSGMGPGMLSGIYGPEELRFHIRKMVEDRGATFLEDKVVKINPSARIVSLQSGESVKYDVISFNTGSEVYPRFSKAIGENVFSVKPIINLLKAKQYILEHVGNKELRVVIIGGGPAGVEITGNVWRLIHDNKGKAQIDLFAGTKLLKKLPERLRNMVRSSFEERGIRIIEGKYMTVSEENSVILDDGTKLSYDAAFIATGVRAGSLFKDSGLAAAEDGAMVVNSHLQSVDYPEIFGGGDCITLKNNPLAKVGVYAVRQNPILRHNIFVALEGGKFRPFSPQKKYMLILNLGNGKGVLWKNTFVWDGRLAFMLKDYIDRKFMKKFQVSGERLEA